MESSFSKLEQVLGHAFTRVDLLERALTHSSTSNAGGMDVLHNETLEFLGDSVLGLAVVERLLEMNPMMGEGDLTQMKHQLVSDRNLSEIAERMGFGAHIRMSKGEEGSGGRMKQAILAGALEAIVGAVFLDAGYASARDMVRRLFGDAIDNAVPKKNTDYKTSLQEYFHARKEDPPVYTVIASEGPPHDMTFEVEAKWKGGSARGSGRSKKQAEMAAAEQALIQLGLPTE